MEIVHVYQRKRAEFGRQCNFDDRSAQMLADIKPNPEMEKDYLVRDPVEFAIQNTKEFSEHEVNTETVTSETRGIYHTEGGWPKDVNPAEADQVSRFRKKVEKTPEFQQQIIQTGQTMEHAIRQNNAIDIYENYFESESENVAVTKPPSIKTVNVYRDPCDQSALSAPCRGIPTRPPNSRLRIQSSSSRRRLKASRPTRTSGTSSAPMPRR